MESQAQVVIGGGFTCVRRTVGDVLCWGDNEQGQLGVGTITTFEPSPAASAGLDDIVQIEVASEGAHACAVRTTGHVACWGQNVLGQLGNGSTSASSPTPTDVPGETG